MLKIAMFTSVALCALTITADAKGQVHAKECNVTMPCDFSYDAKVVAKSIRSDAREIRRVRRGEQVVKAMGGFGSVPERKIELPARAHPAFRFQTSENYGSEVIGGRPPGCPHAFCGCGASIHLFGRIVPGLNLAYEWVRRFPHVPASAAMPRMAAARSGHVMVLEQHISGSIWLVHDSNSGHGLTRLHARSIAGFIIVDPSGGHGGAV